MSILECILTFIVGGGLLTFIYIIIKGDKYDEIKHAPSEDIGVGEPYVPDSSVQEHIESATESTVESAISDAKSKSDANKAKLANRPRDERGRFIKSTK